MRTIILGCGPAGLIAAHAIHNLTGRVPAIASKPRKSELFGAQYLHAPIPGLQSTMVPGTLINYSLNGDADWYKSKVYGDAWPDRVSPEDLIGEHYAWDIRAAYDELWDLYGADVIDTDLNIRTSADAHRLDGLIAGVDLVVSSVPKPLLCRAGHTFSSQKVWAMGDAPERGQRCPVNVANNMVLCNGNKEPSWYRASNVFGYSTAEWPHDSKPPIPGVSEVSKPLTNNCNCWPDIVHVGRYGKWEKGVLSHTAYIDTSSAVGERRG